jgi:lipopolysaccharide export system ATP-binding protein
VSISVAHGEVVGLLGANGAGKTTTFYMMVGLERAEKGDIFLDGRDVTVLPMYLRPSFESSRPNRTFSPYSKQ